MVQLSVKILFKCLDCQNMLFFLRNTQPKWELANSPVSQSTHFWTQNSCLIFWTMRRWWNNQMATTEITCSFRPKKNKVQGKVSLDVPCVVYKVYQIHAFSTLQLYDLPHIFRWSHPFCFLPFAVAFTLVYVAHLSSHCRHYFNWTYYSVLFILRLNSKHLYRLR